MNDLRTVDTILADAEEAVANRKVWSPTVWVEASWSLTALLGNESDKLHELQQRVAKERAQSISMDMTVAKANAMIEATDLYREMLTQKAKIKRVEELVRIAKVMARMKESELHS